MSARKNNINYCKVAGETYTDFAESTSIHGVQNTINKNLFLRFIWILIVAAGIGFAFYLMMLIWMRYKSSPTTTFIETIYAPTSQLPFPAVTICNNNAIVSKKVKSFAYKLKMFDTTPEEIAELLPLVKALIGFGFTDINITDISSLRKLLLKNDLTEFDAFLEISENCDEMLLKCVWNRVEVDCKSIFTESYNSRGRCCTFNYNLRGKKAQLFTKQYGVHMGLKVLLKSLMSKDTNNGLVNSLGFTIIIHAATDYPTYSDQYRIISPKSVQFIQISAITIEDSPEVKDLPENTRNCRNISGKVDDYFPIYSDQNCLISCIIRKFIKKCGCIPFSYYSIGEPVCDSQKLACLKFVGYKHRDCGCPNECEEIQYTVLSSGTNLVHDQNAATNLLDGVNISSTSLINVFYARDTFTRMKRDLATNNMYLLASLGGIFSLLLGCSFTSAVEVLYYIFIRYIICLKIINRKKPRVFPIILNQPRSIYVERREFLH